MPISRALLAALVVVAASVACNDTDLASVAGKTSSGEARSRNSFKGKSGDTKGNANGAQDGGETGDDDDDGIPGKDDDDIEGDLTVDNGDLDADQNPGDVVGDEGDLSANTDPGGLILDEGGLDAAKNFIAVAAGKTGGPRVTGLRIANPTNQIFDVFPFDANTRDGAVPAVGDFDGDGVVDVAVAVGEGQVGHTKILDRNGNEKWGFYGFDDNTYRGGFSLAACDVDGNGQWDLVMGAYGPGMAPRVTILSGGRPDAKLANFFAFDAGRRNGVTVGCADIDGDGKHEFLVTEARGAAPVVKVFSMKTGSPVEIHSISGTFEASFTGGANLAGGDITGDGKDEIIVGAGTGGAPRVVIYDGTNLGNRVADFMAFDIGAYNQETARFGVSVAAVRKSSNMRAALLLVGAGYGGSAHVRLLSKPSGTSSGTVVLNTILFEGTFRGGAFVSAWGPK